MSDFLHNLVIRSLDAEAGIQPRPPLLFEPLKLSRGQKIDQPMETAQPNPDPTSDYNHPNLTGPTPTILKSAAKSQQAPELWPLPEASQSTSHPTSSPALQPGEVEPPILNSGEKPNPEGDKSNLVNVDRETDLISSPITLEAEAGPRFEQVTQRTVTEPVPLNAKIKQPETAHLELAPVDNSKASKPTPFAVQARVKPAPPLEPVSPVAMREAPPEAVPTVQVTIGRVEVRATPPPAPKPKKPRPRQPVMSLDEYLRERARGDR